MIAIGYVYINVEEISHIVHTPGLYYTVYFRGCADSWVRLDEEEMNLLKPHLEPVAPKTHYIDLGPR